MGEVRPETANALSKIPSHQLKERKEHEVSNIQARASIPNDARVV